MKTQLKLGYIYTDKQLYDYIIVGGGTAGCVLASRLVEDNKTSVLLIEAGTDSEGEYLAGWALFLQGTTAWKYSVEDIGFIHKSRKTITGNLIQGRVLGGSSSLNYNLYSTGSKHDYNEWAKITKDPTWNWNNVLPFLKKSQRLEDSVILETDSDYFGKNGNIGLTVNRVIGTIKTQPYLNMFKDIGNDIVPSVNGNVSIGYTNAIYTISKGIRQNTAYAYLTPKSNYKKLHVLRNTLVRKILITKTKKAIGVVGVMSNKKEVVLKARKEVILAAGVVNTPKLLMLSGIGPKKHLKLHNISTISDLPVGENFQSPVGVKLFFNMTNKVEPYRPLIPQLYPSATLAGYVNMNKSSNYPDYQTNTFVLYPKLLMLYCSITAYFKNTICNNLLQTSVNSQVVLSVINKQKCKSRGKILLKSNDYRDDPLVYMGYYDEKEDLEDHAKMVIDYLKITKSKTFKNLGGEIKDPKISECGPMNTKSIKYWKCYIPYMISSQHKHSSTCSMGKVVDSRLRVYGVRKLRIVDASVMPTTPSGGTLGPTIMIGEKAAEIILEDKK